MILNMSCQLHSSLTLSCQEVHQSSHVSKLNFWHLTVPLRGRTILISWINIYELVILEINMILKLAQLFSFLLPIDRSFLYGVTSPWMRSSWRHTPRLARDMKVVPCLRSQILHAYCLVIIRCQNRLVVLNVVRIRVHNICRCNRSPRFLTESHVQEGPTGLQNILIYPLKIHITMACCKALILIPSSSRVNGQFERRIDVGRTLISFARDVTH